MSLTFSKTLLFYYIDIYKEREKKRERESAIVCTVCGRLHCECVYRYECVPGYIAKRIDVI